MADIIKYDYSAPNQSDFADGHRSRGDSSREVFNCKMDKNAQQ